jgi:hypothetical protein
MVEIDSLPFDRVFSPHPTDGKSHAVRPEGRGCRSVCGRSFSLPTPVARLGEVPVTCGRCRRSLGKVLGFTRADNRRRGELIEKEFSGFTEEEGQRRLDLDPAWKAEFERRLAANLTDAERAELADLQARGAWFVDLLLPLPTVDLDGLERRVAELEAGHADRASTTD